jgi:hypothetical protein
MRFRVAPLTRATVANYVRAARADVVTLSNLVCNLPDVQLI